MIDKIKGEASRSLKKCFLQNSQAKVVVKTKDGREFSEYLEYPKGDPREPMTMEDLDNKFNALSEKLISSDKRKKIKKQFLIQKNLQQKSL